MNRFVHASDAAAPPYLCWQADAPVGKTTLLADYVLRPPRDTDILNFFISPTHGNTRAAFEEEMAQQLTLLRLSEPCDLSSIRGPRQWRRLFTAAAEKSLTQGRRLLLVVDGLDDDVAWSGARTGDAPAPPSNQDSRRSADGSIAALLPLAPPPGMRIIVSLRRCLRFPDDLAPSHPVRLPAHLWALRPLDGLPGVRSIQSAASGAGQAVQRFLAVSGGGLRETDLAELTGFPTGELSSVLQGPQGRAVVIDDPTFETYALVQADLVTAVTAQMGHGAAARRTRELLAWCDRWRAAGWPEQTPPYPLAHQLRVLATAAQRSAYVLDWPRLRRLASTAGTDTALAQLQAFEEEIDTAPDTGNRLAMLVALACLRTLLHRQAHQVPPEAARLLVRLGNVERARALACSAPTAQMRAVHLADVAVEMARAGHAGAEAVAHEAAGCLPPFNPQHPQGAHDPTALPQLLDAAKELMSLHAPNAARPLLRAVVRDRGAGIEVLCAAAAMLRTAQDPQAAAALFEHAQMLAEGGLRQRTAAVELWGALARALPQFGTCAGDQIEAVCADLHPSDGLPRVDVLAVAACALAQLPAKRRKPAGTLLRQALAQITAALTDPDALSADDLSHLGRDLAGTLARLTQAVDAAGVGRNALADIDHLLQALPEHLRTGVLGDVISERAQFLARAAEERRASEDDAAAADARQRKNAQRRAKAWMLAPAQFNTTTVTEPDHAVRKSSRTAAAQRTPSRPATSDLPTPTGPTALIQAAENELLAGNALTARKLLDEALRPLPACRTITGAHNRWSTDLVQALGTIGQFDHGEAIAAQATDAEDHARHLAALALGGCLGGHRQASTHAHRAARLLPSDADSPTRSAVAQALAYTGDAQAALTAADALQGIQKRQALTAVAAALAPRCPDEAARIAEQLTEALARRISPGSSLRVLPELAALLLAFPQGRQPDPRLRETLHLAATHVTDTPQTQHPPSLALLALLQQLGHLAPDTLPPHAGPLQRQHPSRHAHTPGAEPAVLAVLAALNEDTATLRHFTDTAQTPTQRAAVLYTAAAHLAASPTPLTPDSQAPDKTARTCLALAHSAGDGTPPNTPHAHHLTRLLLTPDTWTHAIPLLPQLAPQALTHLSRFSQKTEEPTDHSETQHHYRDMRTDAPNDEK
ncbi:hypothetical protein [Streptomyces sp. NPDC051001]|uniref:hypothetical protein n=1 Tax=Streptomyces sp. NPDC051001 TaxID=3155795 RepID=UPI003418725E